MKKTYELWALGYDQDDMITDYEELLKEFDTKEEAFKYIKENKENLFTKKVCEDNVYTIHIQLEEVINTKDYSEAIDILWEDNFSI